MGIVLGTNQYGKAEVRLVHVDRSTPRHVITDVNVTSQLFGDFAETHLTGSNAAVIATDTQKNTVYALARTGGITTIEEFALRMARNFVDYYDQVTGARQEIEQYGWDRIATTEVRRRPRPRVRPRRHRDPHRRRHQARRGRDRDLRA